MQSENKSFLGMIILAGAIVLLVIVLILYLFLNFCRARIAPVASTTEEKVMIDDSVGVIPSAVPGADTKNPIKISNVSGTDPTIVEVIKKANQHVVLPSGKVTVATVLHASEMRKVNPIFYRLAKDGDKLLIYTDEAILYDPVLDRVLDIWHFPPQSGQK